MNQTDRPQAGEVIEALLLNPDVLWEVLFRFRRTPPKIAGPWVVEGTVRTPIARYDSKNELAVHISTVPWPSHTRWIWTCHSEHCLASNSSAPDREAYIYNTAQEARDAADEHLRAHGWHLIDEEVA